KTISTNVKDYIDTKDKDILKESKISFKDAKNEKDKTYPKVGTYHGEFAYKKDKLAFKVVVKDTTKPKFIDFKDTIKVQIDAKDVDLSKYFKAEDLSEYKISVKDGNKKNPFIISKEGSYEVEVIAKDIYKNQTTKKAKIEVVKEKEKLTSTVDGATPVNEATKKEEAASNPTPPPVNGGSTPSVPTPPAPPAQSEPFFVRDEASKYFAQINDWRVQNGAPAMPVTAKAQAYADKRALELVNNYAHDNTTIGLGENIGNGPIGADFFTAWKNSPGHNAAMLRGYRLNSDSPTEYIGIAVSVVQANGKWFAITVFEINLAPWN
ncbi:MAG: CAP domain-containing protein, partial [Erysipelotrichaceae bacterium]